MGGKGFSNANFKVLKLCSMPSVVSIPQSSCIQTVLLIANKHTGYDKHGGFFFVSWTESHVPLFNASFETNPLDGKCDQRAEVKSQPVKAVYDAVSSKTPYNLPANTSVEVWWSSVISNLQG